MKAYPWFSEASGPYQGKYWVGHVSIGRTDFGGLGLARAGNEPPFLVSETECEAMALVEAAARLEATVKEMLAKAEALRAKHEDAKP